MRHKSLRMALLGTVSITGLLVSNSALLAQELRDSDEFIGTVELNESKREISTDTAVPVTTIDQAEIDDRQANTIAELIDSVPGVTLVNGSTPQGSGINIRGFGANSTYGTDQKVLVTVDGANTGAEEIYRIGTQLFTDPELYKNVEVIRGTVGSFEYGSGVVGGVVNLETKDASDFTGGEVGLRFRQMLGAASNGNGFVTSSTLAWQPTTDLEFLLNYTYRQQDNQDGGGDAGEIGNSAFELPSYLVKGKYRFGANKAHSITASYSSTTSEERDVPYDTFQTSGSVFGNVDRDIDTQTIGLKYEFNPIDNDLIDLSVNLTYADQQINQEYVPGSSICDVPPYPSFICGFPFPITGFPTVNADHRYETTKLTVKNSAYFDTGAISHNLRAGLELINRERLDAASAPGGTDKRLAFFAVDDMQVGNWTFTPAIRYETQDIEGNAGAPAPENASYDNDALMGGLSARYEFNSGWAVFGSAAYTESLPIIDDLGTPLYMTQPERSHTYELGFSYLGADVFGSGDVVRAKVNAYATRLWDVTSYSGVSEVNTEGLEFELSYAAANGMYVDFNANIVDGESTSTAGVIGDWRSTPADSARLTLGKRFGDAWDVSYELVGAREVTDSTGSVANGFVVSNLRTTWRPQDGVLRGAEVRVGVENLFDKEYTPHLSTRVAPGRNVKLTVAKTF